MNIKTLEIHAWDLIRNRNDYSTFEVIALPEVFALGKSSIKFRVRDGSLLKDSAINFIAEDYYGSRINYDVLDFIDENSCRIISIDITKKTSAGISRIAFYGTHPNGKYVAMILEVPVDKSDVVSNAPLFVSAPTINITEFSASITELEVPQIEDENDVSGNTLVDDPTYTSNTRRRFVDIDAGDMTYVTSKNTSGGRVDTDVSNRFQEMSYLDDGGRVVVSGKVLYMDSSETFIRTSNNTFNRSMVGGRLDLKSYSTNILEVLSDTHVKVYPPFGYRNDGDLDFPIPSFDIGSGSIRIEYNDDIITNTGSAVEESFIKMQFDGITPSSGDLRTIEILGKAVGSLDSSKVIAEISIDNQSVLVDEGRIFIDPLEGGRFGRIGSDLLDFEFDSYWATNSIVASVNAPKSSNFTRGVVLDISSSGDPKISTIGSYRFREKSIYKLTAKFNVVSNASGSNSIYVTIPNRSVRINERDKLPNNYNTFLSSRGISNDEVLFTRSIESGSVVVDELFEFNGDDDGQVEVHFDSKDTIIQMEYIDIEIDSETHRPCNSYTAIIPLKGLLRNSEYNFNTKFKSSHGLYSNTEVGVNGFKVVGQDVISSGSFQTLSYDSGSGELSISGGNSVVIRPGGGSLGDLHEVLYFTGSASTTWSSVHSLGKIPSINIFTLDDGVYTHGRSTIADATTTSVSVEFRYAQRGFLVLN